MNITLEDIAAGSDMHKLLTSTTLFIDEARMAQVIRNLMSNALKFTPPGGVVRITAERITDSIVSKGGVSSGLVDLLRLQFIDSGAGISPVCTTIFIMHITREPGYFNSS